jgi:hypothetical protein
MIAGLPMRNEFLQVCLWVYLTISLVLVLSTGYVYSVNARRRADDPQKQDYHPLAFVLLPLWPLAFLGLVGSFVLRAVAYGLFLVLFTLTLIFIRQPFLLRLLLRAAQYLGDRALRLNTWILRQVFILPLPQPTTKALASSQAYSSG